MKKIKIILILLFVFSTILNVVLLNTNVYDGKYSCVADEAKYIVINKNVITSSDFFIGSIYSSDKDGISFRYIKWDGDLANLNESFQRKTVFTLESNHYNGTEKITNTYKCREAIILHILYSLVMILTAGSYFFINRKKGTT